MAYIDRVTRPAEFAFNYTLPVSPMEEASMPKKARHLGIACRLRSFRFDYA